MHTGSNEKKNPHQCANFWCMDDAIAPEALRLLPRLYRVRNAQDSSTTFLLSLQGLQRTGPGQAEGRPTQDFQRAIAQP